jgi:hypothetical protein
MKKEKGRCFRYLDTPGPFVLVGTELEGRWEAPCGCMKYHSEFVAGTMTADACEAHGTWADLFNGQA